MKRSLLVVMILGLVAASAVTAEARGTDRKRATRTVEGSYATQFVPFGGLVTHTCRPDDGVGCVTMETRANEAYVTAKVVDAHGQPVLVTVKGQDPFGESGDWIHYGTFCGETVRPIAFPRGTDISFSIGYFWLELPNSLADCRPMFGTTGTISATFSTLP